MRNKTLLRVFCIVLIVCFVLTSLAPMVFADITYTGKGGQIIKLQDFKDTQKHWAKVAIKKWAEFGVITGNEGNFEPSKPIKRADIAVIFDRMLGLKTLAYNYFNDLPNNAYYRDALLRCVAEGYFSGAGSNNINPTGYATREELAVVLCRIFQIPTQTGNTNFIDDGTIASWAKPSVKALASLGYMNGSMGRVNPKSNITRAEVVQLLDNMCEGYIPVKDTTNLGGTFSNNFTKNFVVARNIEFLRGTVGRDLILTQAITNMNINQSNVKGRLLVYGNSNVSLSASSVNKIDIRNKSTISGIDENVGEVYIGEYGTESTLDAIPNKLVLSAGTRIKIDGVMYENIGSNDKTYYGSDIKADIAKEQGFVTGGPRVSGAEFLQTMNNDINVQNIRLTVGKNGVSEVGVIYNNGIEAPTLADNDGKIRFTGKITADPITIETGKISGARTYRVYTTDNKGLIGYSAPQKFTAYSYTTELKLVNVEYPKQFRVEVLFTGTNIPPIQRVKVVCDLDETYKESHTEITMVRYENPDAETGNNEVDKEKQAIRFTGDVIVPATYDAVNDSYVYYAPKAFGYIINFSGAVGTINRFPILTNAVPDDIKPVDVMKTGTGQFITTNRLRVSNNRIDTSYITLQEAGILYKETADGVNPGAPTISGSGWTKQVASVTGGVKDTIYYNSDIAVSSATGETHYAAYVKTSNGYYYGDVKMVKNNWAGDVDGPKMTGNPNVIVLEDTKAVVKIPLQVSTPIDTNRIGSIIRFTKADTGQSVVKYDNQALRVAQGTQNLSGNELSLVFDSLEKNTIYNCYIQLYDTNGKASNAITFNINTGSLVTMALTNKTVSGTRMTYTLVMPTGYVNDYDVSSADVLNSSATASVNDSSTPWQLIVDNAPTGTSKVDVTFNYYLSRNVGDIRVVTFTREFTIIK